MLLEVLLAVCSCTENVDISARYVFKESTAISYLQKYSDTYSEYLDILFKVHASPVSETTVGQLLTARGHYTIFAPTNEAIHTYLEELAASPKEDYITSPSWDGFRDSTKLDSIRQVIVLNSIIDSGDNDQPFLTFDFPIKDGGEFARANLNDRKLSVYTNLYTDEFLINGEYLMDNRNCNILVLNGVIHQMKKVIAPQNITANVYLQDILDKQQEGYMVMARAIQACGLFDTLSAYRDEVYEAMYQRGEIPDLVGMTNWGFAEGSTAYAPEHRKVGFTIFAEKDAFWREQGFDPTDPDLLQKLQQWIVDQHQYSDEDVFTTGTDYTSEENLLNQWTTYHILPMKIPNDKLVIHYNELGYSRNSLGVPVYEMYTSFGKRRLLKIYESKESNGVYLNRFPKLDNGRTGTGHEISCAPDKVGCRVGADVEDAVLSDIINCNIYPIDAPLSYNDEVRDNMAKERIRFDGMSLFPEAMTNDIRKKAATEERYQHVYIPKRSVYPYFENMWIDDNCNFVYYNAYGYEWPNKDADEMKAVGRYELTFVFPPVPRRTTYELRYGYIATAPRGVAQIYFGTDINNLPVADIPFDLTVSDWEQMGYEHDTEDQDYNAEVDKRMHNNTYMKGCNTYCMNGDPARAGRKITSYTCVRRVLLKQTMDPNETYYFRMKSVLDNDRKEFQMDYMEYCPKEVYDNPNEPEDIW